ncbi:hypothetical protein M404DRAFT_22737 [Pisolithus tinctorius Marx 270]|uniref:Uncharacterized protein n=1 Tax=Pisolithus tinctorius Marx 270 TaxID=870435 RepID=A0A0C3PJY9_PISTI|nr:hypothetical protein M404DRAFT_22737 [Pisolithus tinctorius Marx 270]
MSMRWSKTPYNQDLLPNLTQVTSVKLQVGSDDDEQAIWGKLAECKRCKVKAQEEAWLAEEARLEAKRQEQAWLKEERAHAEAEAQRLETVRKAEEARKAEESWWVVQPGLGQTSRCLRCDWTNMVCVCSTDSKKWWLACNWCNELKERCQWPVEGETSQGSGSAADKGKRKANVSSLHAGEKKKRSQKPSTKVDEGAGDDEVEVLAELLKKAGAGKVTGEETRTGPVTGDQMERLIKVVKHVADNSYETYVEEHFEFLMPDAPSDWDITTKEDEDVKGLDEELEGLREDEEDSQSWSESGDQASASSAGSQA